MLVRNLEPSDQKSVNEIFRLYWNDHEFIEEIEEKINSFLKGNKKVGFYIVEKEGEIVGIGGFRSVEDYLGEYAKTKKPAELYILASKYKRQGIGKILGEKMLEEIEKLGFSEILCYSPETHADSWIFYDKLGLKRHGIIKDPDSYPGMLWLKNTAS